MEEKRQKWYIVFGENAFRNRYVTFEGTVSECRRQMIFWRLDGLVSAVVAERDFLAGGYEGYKEIDIEGE